MSFAALFPGQGSQVVGMGHQLFEADSLARDLFAEADSVLGYSLSKLCFSGPTEELTLTQNAQPALLTVSYIAFRLLGQAPKCAAGHSLGEYSALVAAGALSFADAVQLVHKRGRYMQEAVSPGAGKMVAVLGAEVEEISQTIEAGSKGVAQIANLNCPGQTVVAGDNEGIDEFVARITAKGQKVIPLNVSAPFHCRLMKPAEDKLAKDLNATSFSNPLFPVYSNVSAQAVREGAEARSLLIKQVCSAVRWTESMQTLVRETGVKRAIEFGPGKVLSKLFKRIDKSVECLEVAEPQTLSAARALF